jgi:CheY-like chemotaxis protein
MGGALSVTSIVGQGSTFTVRLPLRRAAHTSAPAVRAGAADTGLAGASLLLVEANPLAQSVLKAALGPQVASVEVVPTLAAALTALGDRPFDLVLAEGRTLADGEEPFAGLAPLVAAAGRGRVSILWGGAPEEVASLTDAGAHHVARKPISATDLVVELQHLFSAADDGQPMRLAV